MKDYCNYCMTPLDAEGANCPKCGKNNSKTVPAHHLLPGTVLSGKFRVGVALGEGGFGITYIGRDTNLDIRVAIKEFYPNGYVNRSNTVSPCVNKSVSDSRKNFFEKGRERFLKEARILAKFSGEPGVVDVRDFFEENNTAYIVMEYLDGTDLKKYLKENGTLSPERTVQLLAPVMASLKKIHQQGLIHRDISPDNIMLVGEGVKLLDFGAARNVSAEANKSISVMLKPGYAPEEQYRSKGVQGPWTDVYALCATMYKCITGITPDDATQRVFSDDVKTPSALGVSIPKEIETAIMRGMSVHQQDRYQSIEELISGLQGVGVTLCGDDRTVTASGAKIVEDDIMTRFEVQDDDGATVLGEDLSVGSADTQAEPLPEEITASESQAVKAEEKSEPVVTPSQKPEPAKEERANEEKVNIKPKKAEKPESSADIDPKPVRKAEKQDAAGKEEKAEKESTAPKKINKLFVGIGAGIVGVVAVVLLLVFLLPKGESPAGGELVDVTVDYNIPAEETVDTAVEETADITANGYYDFGFLADYQQPTEIDSLNKQKVVSIEGVWYQMPCPVTTFMQNGWTLHSENNLSELEPLEYADAYLSMDDKSFMIEIGNFSDSVADRTQCVVYGVWIDNDSNVDVALPGYESVALGISKGELEAVLPDENSDDALYCEERTGYFSYSYIVGSDSGSNMLCIDVDADTELVESIYVSNDGWDYSSEFRTLDISVRGCPYGYEREGY